MKKIVLSLALLVAAVFAARADGNSREILDRMVDNMSEYENYRIDFTASGKSLPAKVGGMYVVSGDRYYIKIQRQEQFSDGVTRWEINPSDREVVIDYMNLENRNILENPTRAFKFAPAEFTSTYLGIETMNGMPCHTIRLEPKGRIHGIGVVKLHVSIHTELPAAISYDFEGERLDISIDRFTGLAEADEELFRFDDSKYRNYEIIDFRD